MTGSTRRKRLTRFRPEQKAFPPTELNERHRRILELVYQHRFLDTGLLSHLLDAVQPAPEAQSADCAVRPRKYGFGAQALYERLQTLFNAR